MKKKIICISVCLLIIGTIIPSAQSITKDIILCSSEPNITQAGTSHNTTNDETTNHSVDTIHNEMSNSWRQMSYFPFEPISTSVNPIVPYEVIKKPLTITVTGDAYLDNIQLWYRYSLDNVSWSDTKTWFTWMDTANDGDEFKSMDYPNTARILWHNSSTICAYVAVFARSGKDEGITILNVTDSDNPVEMSHKSHSVYLNGTHDIQVVEYSPRNRVAFVISYSAPIRYISSWNVTNPYDITMMDMSPPSRSAIGMYLTVDVQHKILFATWYDGYLTSYDISDPSDIVPLDSENYGLEKPWYPCYNNGHVYVGNIGTSAGITVFGVSTNGTITGEKTYNETYSMPMPQVKGNYLYVLDNTNKKFVIYDVSDPDEWIWKSSSSWGSGTEATHFCLDENNFAYLRIYNATADDGIHVVNVTSKTSPTHYAWLAYNTTNLMRRCHWMEVFYNNITLRYNLYVINYIDDAWVQYDLSNWFSFGKVSETPWSWVFPFPNGNGYYEFYSIGKKNKEIELPPETADARCCLAVTSLPPSIPEQPYGESTCKINKEYSYTTTTTEPNGDDIWYWYDWGDGTNSGWIGPFVSGETCNASHAWTKRDTYMIQIKAKDSYGSESTYSDPFEVNVRYIVTQNIIEPTVLERFFDYFPNLFLLLRHLFDNLYSENTSEPFNSIFV
jgi:hypothetical protein